MAEFIEIPKAPGRITTTKRSVYGIGINDADYLVSLNDNGASPIYCPFYSLWRSMLSRCYAPSSPRIARNYKGVTVCDSWHWFMTFRAWVKTQDYKGKELDKDLLSPGNKVYSPEACMFVTSEVNSAISARNRGKMPFGVAAVKLKTRTKYHAVGYVGVGDKGRSGTFNLGCFDTVEEAAGVCINHKHTMILDLAARQEDSRVIRGLLRYAKEVLNGN